MPVVDVVAEVNLDVVGEIEGAAQLRTWEIGQRVEEEIVDRLEGNIYAPLSFWSGGSCPLCELTHGCNG